MKTTLLLIFSICSIATAQEIKVKSIYGNEFGIKKTGSVYIARGNNTVVYYDNGGGTKERIAAVIVKAMFESDNPVFTMCPTNCTVDSQYDCTAIDDNGNVIQWYGWWFQVFSNCPRWSSLILTY